MKISRSKRRRMMAAGFTALVVTAGTAFAATNTVADRNAGAGTSVVSGYTVNSVGYEAASLPIYVGRVTSPTSSVMSTRWSSIRRTPRCSSAWTTARRSTTAR
ncbi:MAG: hypothetical protein R2694_16170 [Ilumatobacteraceae bacterium]